MRIELVSSHCCCQPHHHYLQIMMVRLATTVGRNKFNSHYLNKSHKEISDLADGKVGVLAASSFILSFRDRTDNRPGDGGGDGAVRKVREHRKQGINASCIKNLKCL